MSNGYDPVDLRGQESTREEDEARKRLEQKVEQSDWRWLMGNKVGRRIIWRLLVDVGVFRYSFNTNAMQMAFNEGSRNVGLKILDAIKRYCPATYDAMAREAREQEECQR